MAALVGPRHRLVVDDRRDARTAARLLAEGAVVAHGFGNIYALTTAGDRETVRRVNALKGRPLDQVGSLTAPSDQVLRYLELGVLPGDAAASARQVVEAFVGLGPIGFRGPAAAGVPPHLTSTEDRVVTTQVIVPGLACPSNAFLAVAAAAVAPVPLAITSANRSRHVTGAADEPAHWRADALVSDLGDADVVLVEHRDEAAARARFPGHAPTSTTILGLHGMARIDGRWCVSAERSGSLDMDTVRATLARLGLGLRVRPRATDRLAVRQYAT